MFAGLWFGKGKPHLPTFLRPFSLSIQGLFSSGLTVPSPTEQEVRTHKAILLDVAVYAPARAMWLCMKQFNGYFGCGKCKEPGKQLMIGVGEKNVQFN